MAAAIRRLPLSRRRVLAEALEDERLADLLEELSEDEQVRLVEELDQDRLARVLDEMEADDAADLLGEFSASRQAELLGAMDPDEAEPVRRLLTYKPDTAGGLMTPEPIILGPQATVAEALARIRDPDLPVPLAAQVFVSQPPLETPTGRYLGMVGIQRLLREAPSKPLGRCVEEDVEPVDVELRAIARSPAGSPPTTWSRLPVTDEVGRLVGAVTIDDVLDHLLPGELADRGRPDGGAGMTWRGATTSRPPRGTPGGPVYDPDAFARFAERLARFLGTGRYLAAQTILVFVWIMLNGVAFTCAGTRTRSSCSTSRSRPRPRTRRR